jgi:transcriptional regulator with XRE-family HTH domain
VATAPVEAAVLARSDEVALAAAVGRRIRRERRRAGVSQGALAARVGCARPTVGRWERGQRLPTLGSLVRIAAALGVAPAALLPGSDGEGGG